MDHYYQLTPNLRTIGMLIQQTEATTCERSHTCWHQDAMNFNKKPRNHSLELRRCLKGHNLDGGVGNPNLRQILPHLGDD
jgi:hypothetical protein